MLNVLSVTECARVIINNLFIREYISHRCEQYCFWAGNIKIIININNNKLCSMSKEQLAQHQYSVVLSDEYFAQLPLHCGGAEDDEKHLPTLGVATVALEDTFSGFGVAERRVVVIGEHS